MTDREITETRPVSQSMPALFSTVPRVHFVHNLLISGRKMWNVFRVLHGTKNSFHTGRSVSSSSPLSFRIPLTGYRQKTAGTNDL